MSDIDFVIPWVDGNEEEWKKDYNKYSDLEIDTVEERYRDWDSLIYLFRGIEKNTPWVRKIHFITHGHLPKWLNTKNPKLNIVQHNQIIEKKNIPTFNSHSIEINLHRIKDLTKKFVYLNDDIFFIKTLEKADFFTKNLPNDMPIMSLIYPDISSHIEINNMIALGRNFDKKKNIKKYFNKWFNISFGIKNLIKNIFFYHTNKFTGFDRAHVHQPFLKSTFEDLWNKESELLKKVESSRYRNYSIDINQYLFRDYQLMNGNFSPKNTSKFKGLPITPKNINKIESIIKNKKYSSICLNDTPEVIKSNFEILKNKINNAFETILSEKSSFEI